MISAIIIIPEITKGMKSIGSKSLLKIKDSTIIEHQINQIKAIHPDINITILTGFDNEKILKCLEHKYSDISILYNENYANTNQAQSIALYIQEHKDIDGLLMIGSGILIKKLTINMSILQNNNKLFILDKAKSNFNIGCDRTADTEYLFYDLPLPWSECAYFNRATLNTLGELFVKNNLSQMYIFELINELIHSHIVFDREYIKTKNILKISSTKDISKAKNFI